MATTTTQLLSSSPQSYHLLTPTTNPVPLLSSPTAKLISNGYTAAVALYYYLRADALVSDPLSTLLQDLMPIASFQALFCLACVPGAGFWNSGTEVGLTAGRTGGKSKHDRRPAAGTPASKQRITAGGSRSEERGVTGGLMQHRIMPMVFSLVLTLTVPIVPLAALALVLGAPLYPTSLLPHTFAVAAHVALLAIMPVFYTHGVSSLAWRDFAAAWLPFDEAGVWAGAVGCMVGGWVGAIPMALDWDREWQKWPCTVVWGTVLGWAIGRFLTGVLRFGIGKRINLSENLRAEGHLYQTKTNLTAERKSK